MPVITRIEEQKNNDDRVNIYIDDKFFIGTFKEIVYKLGLEENTEVDEEGLRLMVEEEMYLSAKKKAYNILSRTMQSEGQIRDKLSRKGFDEYIIKRVIKDLKKYKMINDEEMAKYIVRNKKSVKRHGKNRIIYELNNKKIDKKIIDSIVNREIDEEEEYANAVYLAEKKMKTIKDTDKMKIYNKLYYHLAYKGYNHNIIRKAVAKVMGEIYLE